MNRIVVPIDFSAAAASALRFAVKLADVTGMKVTAVYVFNSLITSNRRETQEELAEDRRLLCKELKAFTKRHVGTDPASTSVEVVVAEGIPPVYIQWLSHDSNVALIVMGGIGTGSGGHKDMFGGIAKAISREGGCPIVLIPEKFADAAMETTAHHLEGLSALSCMDTE
ncbi:universal stress protein [Neolewinella litorea]|uniref:Universal stress protein n=1 Tax=Neolewinella litorea TaxID=2562452 RepID=A0A4S4N6C8_9BACT|nr:universal stress protein [Neolewinella litorea]THH34599.1 universal stress protein [Neolewinella litorea]